MLKHSVAIALLTTFGVTLVAGAESPDRTRWQATSEIKISGLPVATPERLELVLEAGDDTVHLSLNRHRVRSPSFKLLQRTESGTDELYAPPERTYSGIVSDDPGSTAIVSLVGDGLRGLRRR